ncbi:hypothetical protein OQH61_08915 [Helicobacter sp. MIT 21-1697]|uniref:hypothetical protein n=1 Tax=Helicobacter sp. MIT 21-1697 TaxID=2993733 RepID=UPI00224A8150|nr:hypothetical protein [Helicobacter sp. MIT 21-1697]MCX2717852.1 hypothetical protein [Helicobacter sp. MIT 21-1697]
MQSSGLKQIVIFISSALLFAISYFTLITIVCFFIKIPIFANTEIWLKDMYKIKDMINDKPTTKQRLIVISGSNSLFGLNGAMIEANTQFRFINYATHASLPINYHIDKIIAKAHNGDIIILPLEFNYYSNNAPTKEYWYIENMLSWGNGYYKYIDIIDVVLALLHNNPIQTLSQLIHFIKYTSYQSNQSNIQANMEKIVNQEMIISQNPSMGEEVITLPCQAAEWAGYNYKSSSPNGDFCSQENSKPFYTEYAYLDTQLEVSSFFLSEYKRLKDFADSKNIKIFLFYPVTMENSLFSLTDIKTFQKIENLTSQLATHHINIYGDFRDSHFNSQYFFDTSYHLNNKGVNVRTSIFIKQLLQLPIH